MIQSLKLAAMGDIWVHAVRGSDANQCMDRGVRDFPYRVQIEGDPNALNGQGFILDRHEVYKYFREKYTIVQDLPSCEEMAIQACKDLAVLAKGHAKVIRVDIGGATAEWVPDDHAH